MIPIFVQLNNCRLDTMRQSVKVRLAGTSLRGNNIMRHRGAMLSLVSTAALATTGASAQSTLDKIVQSKTLRCGVQLDYPPAGFRNKNNEADALDYTNHSSLR